MPRQAGLVFPTLRLNVGLELKPQRGRQVSATVKKTFHVERAAGAQQCLTPPTPKAEWTPNLAFIAAHSGKPTPGSQKTMLLFLPFTFQ